MHVATCNHGSTDSVTTLFLCTVISSVRDNLQNQIFNRL